MTRPPDPTAPRPDPDGLGLPTPHPADPEPKPGAEPDVEPDLADFPDLPDAPDIPDAPDLPGVPPGRRKRGGSRFEGTPDVPVPPNRDHDLGPGVTPPG